MLITSEINVRYLTGFTGDSSYLLLSPDEKLILSDRRYEEQLANECSSYQLVVRGPGKLMLELCRDVLQERSPLRLGIESDHITFGLAQAIKATVESIELVGQSGLVESLRSCKDADELNILRRAVALAESAFLQVRSEMKPDWTELQVAWRLEQAVREGGGEKLGFPAIVAVGSASALPHYQSGRRRLGEHPLLLIDWGAKLDGYTSDLTRTIALGEISAELRQVHAIVVAAHDAAIATIRPGVAFETVDAAARSVIDAAGYGPRFSHGLGHGIGLEIHEFPRFAAGQTGTLQAGMVVTVEPGIYLPGVGGVRVEDDCLVTADGCEVLSTLPTGLECAAQV